MDADGDLWKAAADRWRARALRAEASAELLGRVLDHISFVVREKQPEPRSSSVSYVAGYARAMDDVRVAIVDSRRRAQAGLSAVAEAPVPKAIKYGDTRAIEEGPSV